MKPHGAGNDAAVVGRNLELRSLEIPLYGTAKRGWGRRLIWATVFFGALVATVGAVGAWIMPSALWQPSGGDLCDQEASASTMLNGGSREQRLAAQTDPTCGTASR